jgi:beta-galactosidase
MQKQSFNQDWRFHLDGPKDNRRTKLDESSWRVLNLPHDWSIEMERHPDNPSAASNGFFPMGRGRYRKTFQAAEEWRGKKVLVEFEGVYMNAEVFLNEHYLGRHPYGYTSFTHDLTPYLKIGEENVLLVVADNEGQLNSRWYSGSGIYRPVWLIVANPVHIAHWGVFVTTPEISSESALVRIQTRLVNETDQAQEVNLRSRVVAPEGDDAGEAVETLTLPAGGQQEITQELRISDPVLWSPESPDLYRLETELYTESETVDIATTSFGIRTIEFSSEKGFLLNGQPTLIKGGCVHHDNGVLGAASHYRAEERKVEIHKASGYNAIRCAHNPPAPAFLDACDRLGMLVMDEAFDCWRTGKNPFDYHVAYDDWWERDVESMMLRDRNHPSIIMWSIGNEVMERDGRSDGVEIARKLAEKVRSLDTTRPVTSAICGVWDQHRKWEDTDPVFAQLEVGGYNYQWRSYAPDHERHPQRIMLGTESIAMEAFENWNSVEEHSYVIGDFVWTSLDYLGESGIGRVHFDADKKDFLGEYPWHQANCGDLDLCGFKRPQSYYRDILWKNGGPLYLAVHTPIPEGKTPVITYWGWPDVTPNWNWPGKEEQTFKVDVYSAYENVELFLNGRSLGVKPATREERFTASFEVPYEPGELKAVGLKDGQPAAEVAIRTAGDPACIRLTPDRSSIQSGEGDLSYVTVDIVDQDGNVCQTADRTVFFTVMGAGEIAAVGNADPVSTEKYCGNQRSTFNGRALVVVRPTDTPGEVRLRAHADGLEGAEIVITTT